MEAVACGVRRFVGIGTFSEYDERYGARLTVETPLLPTDMYENAKVAAFYALSNFFKLSDTSFSWCRLFSMYGEGEDPKRLVPYIRQQLAAGKPAELTDGCQVRDFLEVSEAARKVVDIALGEEQGPKNICSSKPIMIRDLAKKIAEEYGRPDLLRFGVHQRADTDPFAMVGVE
jgi:dTDP-6-deoxy-L-talose 4-dehydrogenase (NAD+)